MQDTTALITGASGGIGYEIAKLLAKDCSTVVLVARNLERLLDVKKELERTAQVTVKIIAKDLSKPGVTEEIYQELRSENISVDILINNAGIGVAGNFVETDWQKEAELISLNIVALTRLTKLFLKGMVERKRGKIVNLASLAAFQPGPLMAIYYASKAYVLSFSEAIADELRGTGVDVTVLCPGPTSTGFQKAASMEYSRLFRFRQPAIAVDVARYGYDAMKKGKTLAIYGIVNKVMAFSVRLAPRNLVRSIAHHLNDRISS